MRNVSRIREAEVSGAVVGNVGGLLIRSVAHTPGGWRLGTAHSRVIHFPQIHSQVRRFAACQRRLILSHQRHSKLYGPQHRYTMLGLTK